MYRSRLLLSIFLARLIFLVGVTGTRRTSKMNTSWIVFAVSASRADHVLARRTVIDSCLYLWPCLCGVMETS